MKKIVLMVAISLGCLMFKPADAQIHISLGLNIGSQPDWGPVGYDHADYYYMPDIDVYYDVTNHQYVYLQNNAWVHTAVLPSRYHFDPYHSYKVVINQRNPWEHAATIRTKYASFKGHHNQQVIRDNHDQKYRNHWNGDNSHGNNGHPDKGHGDKGHAGKGHGHDDHGDRH